MTNILLADNDLDFLTTRAEYLEAAGFYVYKASTYDQAIQFLQEADLKRIYVAILDIRLINDDDEKDASGLKIAREHVRTLPKIILTNFPTRDSVREALKLGNDGFSAAVDFIDKSEGPEVMISAVKEALGKTPHPKMELEFRWQDRGAGFGLLAYWTDPHGLENLHERAHAIEDLLRMLLRDYDRVTLGRLLWKKHRRVAFEAFCHTATREDQFILICGDQQDIQEEAQNYQDFAPQAFKNGVMRLALLHQAGRFAALAWELLPKVELEELQSFSSFFQEKSEKNIRQMLSLLFRETLGDWYAQGCIQDPVEAGQSHGLPSGFREGLDRLGHEARSKGIVRDLKLSAERVLMEFAESVPIRFRSPEAFLQDAGLPQLSGSAILSPGELDPETILVAPTGRSWITSFKGAGCAFAWRDFALLESAIRFQLLELDSLQHADAFERNAFPAGPLGAAARWDTPSASLSKALGAIQELRNQAAKLVGPDPVPYYLGLLDRTLQELPSGETDQVHTRNELLALLHRYLFAGHLVDLILEGQEMDFSDSSRLQPLEFVEADEIFRIGSRQLELTPTESKLLLLLYRNRNRVVRNEEIIKCFYPETQDLEDQTSWITTTVFRLRKQLGDNRYVRNVRKKGYQLVIDPAQDRQE
jgi:DNA-binding response OmpR family regulator